MTEQREMGERTLPDSIEITWHHGAYYVSIPSWNGGTVYTEPYVKRLREQLGKAREPFEAADDKDWNYLLESLGYSGHGQFWRDVFKQVRALLAQRIEHEPSKLGVEGSNPSERATDLTDDYGASNG